MNLAVFAQGTNDEDGNLEDGDAAEVPINTKLVYLVIIGISFAYYATNKSPKSTLNK